MSSDKKDIEMEEREKQLNEENKSQNKISVEKPEAATVETSLGKIKADNIKEVKPKKIPTGGILMPGFFTRSKSKEKCKEGDSEGHSEEVTELVENKDESSISQAKIKLPNPFRKSKLLSDDDAEKCAEEKDRRNSFCLRLSRVSIFPKKKSNENFETQAKAGLASMETLDDSDKTADKNGEFKNIPLDNKADLDTEEEEPSIIHRIRAYRVAISALMGFILLLIIIVAFVASRSGNGYDSLIKDGKYVSTVTTCGVVEGILDDGAVAFRGIPYARSPTNDLRFRTAQPLNNIEYCWNGTLLAHNATDECLQIRSNGSITGSEDCLTLDVVTPYVRYDSPLPVIVLIGAETFIGDSPSKMRPSARYARSRDVVFVRPNFRMGVLGFLALDILSKDSKPYTSGNYALSDIIEALKWVQFNIRHFGGDPDAVTLFGHRAGGTLATVLATTRGAHKLFARVWATSGGALYPTKTLQESSKENEIYLSKINCVDVECLREKGAKELMEAIPDTWRNLHPDLPTKEEDPDARHQWLVLDGKYLQEHPTTIWNSGNEDKVKLVLGTTAHSSATKKLLMKHKDWTDDLVAHHIRTSVLGKLNLSENALAMYSKNSKDLFRMVSDIRTVCPLLVTSSQMYNSSFYVVTQTRGEQNISDIDSDIDAILGRYEPKTPEQRRYFSAIQQLFYHFVWHGKVQVESGNKKVLVVGQDVLPAQNYSHCDFWINKNIVPKYAYLD